MDTLTKIKSKPIALLPILVFLVLYLGMGLVFEYALNIEMGFYNIPIVVVFMVALLVACLQNRKLKFDDKLGVMAQGVGDKNIMTMLARLDTIREDISNGLFTFEAGASEISHDKETRNNNGVMFYNEQGMSYSKFELQNLPVEVATVVEKMKVGDVSKPIVMEQRNGTVCAIVKLKSRVDGHKANMRDDYDYLKQLYSAKMGEEKVAKWIKEKQKTTYVRINKEYRNSKFLYPDWNFYDESK